MFTRIKRLFILIFNVVWKKIFFIVFYVYFLLSNTHVYCGQIFDNLLTQILRFIDNFTKTLGPVFVITVIVLLCTYIIIAYTIGLCYWYNKSYIVTIIALIIGHWLLINVVWHYYMALTVSPGYLPQDRQFFDTTNVCKKCVLPKPQRTHHCSVCNRCILKMDHHCPWLNNCIGHFNHRYYYLFCVYTWFGTIFVIIFGFPVMKDHFWSQKHSFSNSSLSENSLQSINYSTINNSSLFDSFDYLYVLRHKCIIFETITTVGIFVALGCLIMWHSLLITRGETSIERHINNKETLKMAKYGKKYRNPYDFGSRNNWKIFFGFQNNISWFHILLPSNHLPLGDGIEWRKTIFKSHLNEEYSA